ncbi:GNAT family N-acetyltransferase [Myxococcota bacterium]|nr:GNAT family N-acetyltransferase [Myxococcota bacterium]
MEAQLLRPSQREAAVAFLARDPRRNLLLIELTERLGGANVPGEATVQIVAAWRGQQIIGVASLRPSVVFDAGVTEEILDLFTPYLSAMGVGLVKCAASAVDLLWDRLTRRQRRRVYLDRRETTFELDHSRRLLDPHEQPPRDLAFRRAGTPDLDSLIYAARESLREEQRPDPFLTDAVSFRGWVHGRIPRARLAALDGVVRFVGYADVQREWGWLIQGVYTWPESRRMGLARYAMSEICREAFAAGAAHVQLAVVDGNEPARALYEGLGFTPGDSLRTILFR